MVTTAKLEAELKKLVRCEARRAALVKEIARRRRVSICVAAKKTHARDPEARRRNPKRIYSDRDCSSQNWWIRQAAERERLRFANGFPLCASKGITGEVSDNWARVTCRRCLARRRAIKDKEL